ncbi:hypothetical protein J2I47_17340 [Fibrella sp. HMF5335]|uniref:Uncharacterized protein n=1 Tax=Fibrella rubiginis TaxID=2817060 RepID=A0A939K4E0_9BACT|nr:hypothetical protein [Fibrella rubiginis]MBO0938319.1 hypothetical protein [Fibrella rubiginis]
MEIDYRIYRDLEKHIRTKVHSDFHANGSIGAMDFFCIIIWKSNRAKSKVAKRLFDSNLSLDERCHELTKRIYNEKTNKGKLKILFKEYKFRIPIMSAILSVLYPDDFTVYDFRVCESLKARNENDFSKLESLTNFDELWLRYSNYVEVVKRAIPLYNSLTEKDHYLWGQSFYSQLENHIKSNFANYKE